MTITEEEYRNRLEQVYRNNFSYLVDPARGSIKNKARAEEMVQEAFLIALERPPKHTDGLARWLKWKLRGVISNSRRAGPDATVAPKIKHEIECRDGSCKGKIERERVCSKCGLAYTRDYKAVIAHWASIARAGRREVTTYKPLELNDPRKQFTSSAVDDSGRLRGGTRTKAAHVEYDGKWEWDALALLSPNRELFLGRPSPMNLRRGATLIT